MSASKPNDKANANNAAPNAQKQAAPQGSGKDVPSLGALDEDDEFEEFEAQGEIYPSACIWIRFY